MSRVDAPISFLAASVPLIISRLIIAPSGTEGVARYGAHVAGRGCNLSSRRSSSLSRCWQGRDLIKGQKAMRSRCSTRSPKRAGVGKKSEAGKVAAAIAAHSES